MRAHLPLEKEEEEEEQIFGSPVLPIVVSQSPLDLALEAMEPRATTTNLSMMTKQDTAMTLAPSNYYPYIHSQFPKILTPPGDPLI